MNQEGIWYRDSKQQMKCLCIAVWQKLAGNDRAGIVAGKTADGEEVICRFVVKVDADSNIQYLILEDREVITGKVVSFDTIAARVLPIVENARNQALALHDGNVWEQSRSLVLDATAQTDLQSTRADLLATKAVSDLITQRVLAAAGLSVSPPEKRAANAPLAVCPSCHASLRETAKFCGECGTKVETTSVKAVNLIPSIRLATPVSGLPTIDLSLEGVKLEGHPSENLYTNNCRVSGIAKLGDMDSDWVDVRLSGVFLSADGRTLCEFSNLFDKDETEIPIEVEFASRYRGKLPQEVSDFQVAASVTAFIENPVSVGTLAVPKLRNVNTLLSIELGRFLIPCLSLYTDDSDPDSYPCLTLMSSIQNVSDSNLRGVRLFAIGRDAKGEIVEQSEPTHMADELPPQGIECGPHMCFREKEEGRPDIVQIEVMLLLKSVAATGEVRVRGGELVDIEEDADDSDAIDESESDGDEESDSWNEDEDEESFDEDGADDEEDEGDTSSENDENAEDEASFRDVGSGDDEDGTADAAVEVFLSAGHQRISGDRFFFARNFNVKKLGAALESYAPGVRPEDVLFFVDSTAFGGAKDGLLITREKLYAKNLNEHPISFQMSSIENVDYTPGIFSAKLNLNGAPFFSAEGVEKAGMIVLAELLQQLATMLKTPPRAPPHKKPSSSPLLSTTAGGMKFHAAWDKPYDEGMRCLWFVAWQSIGKNQIAGVVAGYSHSRRSSEVEQFWGELEDGAFAHCVIDQTDRVTDEEVEFFSLSESINAVAETAYDLLFEWNDRDQWNDSENLNLLPNRKKDLIKKGGLWTVKTGHLPAIGELCDFMGLSEYQEE